MAKKGKAFTSLESDAFVRTGSMQNINSMSRHQNVFGPKMNQNLELIKQERDISAVSV